MNMPRLLLAAGGTGGHMFPAQALAEILKSDGWDIAMMTDARGRKHSGNIPADPIIDVEAATVNPKRPIKAVTGLWRLSRGVRQAKKFTRDWKPDVIVGFGGYPAFPAMRAAQSLKIPSLIHEQNAVLGRVNRVFATRARVVASGFDDLEKLPAGANHVPIGNPLRAQIVDAIPEAYEAPTGIINLVIIGGSLGARLISDVVPRAVADLPEDLRKRLHVVQQTREESLSVARMTYEGAYVPNICEPFFSDIQKHLASAHFIIGRAGASSVSEIAAMGKPSLLVPLAIAMDDHQTANANSLKSLGAADILPESEFTPEKVKSILEARLSDSNWLENAARSAKSAARTDAAKAMAKLVKAAIQNA
ncbi:MAG: undecaprenyldiphospho-muramoylpentapeptide beta-N-acetylglucosaminyltransferase [Hellea sp.]|nr:undecaprenyldiphospho-muramoylpentapeptide beta-N-acetylglucosaminyltransferase [Hellea sp.]